MANNGGDYNGGNDMGMHDGGEDEHRKHPDNLGSNHNNNNGSMRRDDVIGSAALRPVFLGNLYEHFTPEDVMAIFERPILPPHIAAKGNFAPIPVDRVDVKRGYCFVFLKDAVAQSDKERLERFVQDINGMEVPNVSDALRVEYARGDGRVKRKEDERRRNIEPSETLFVVNFHEETTKKEDLQMLFEPYGNLVRIEMKRNYAFVQFKTIEEATKAKDATNGGKLDQSVLTVEYTAPRLPDDGRGGGGGRGRDRDRFRGGRDYRGGGGRDRYDDRRGPPRYGGGRDSRGGGRYDNERPARYDRREREDRYPDDVRYRTRERSSPPPPPPPPSGPAPDYRGRPRSRTRSRSPPPGVPQGPRYAGPGVGGGAGGGGGGYHRRSRSPPRDRRGYDDRDYPPPRDRYAEDYPPRGMAGGSEDYRGGRNSPPVDRDRDQYRGADRERGYRP